MFSGTQWEQNRQNNPIHSLTLGSVSGPYIYSCVLHNKKTNVCRGGCTWTWGAVLISDAPPVLSVSRYEMRPSSSGMVLALTTVPGILESLLIIQLKTIFPKSRLTRRLDEMGTITT